MYPGFVTVWVLVLWSGFWLGVPVGTQLGVSQDALFVLRLALYLVVSLIVRWYVFVACVLFRCIVW